MMAARKKAALKIYELHVELEDIEPAIWRRILVPEKITLPKLHDLLQLVMGWTDSHLHSFEIGGRAFGMDGTDLEEVNMVSERGHSLNDVLGDSIREFVYEYDFGDS
jgi:Plasmid pRiA4b ORF-3-like protein